MFSGSVAKAANIIIATPVMARRTAMSGIPTTLLSL
jgi:hypothetical protein